MADNIKPRLIPRIFKQVGYAAFVSSSVMVTCPTSGATIFSDLRTNGHDQMHFVENGRHIGSVDLVGPSQRVVVAISGTAIVTAPRNGLFPSITLSPQGSIIRTGTTSFGLGSYEWADATYVDDAVDNGIYAIDNTSKSVMLLDSNFENP